MLEGKARLPPALVENFFGKHRQRSHPEAVLTIECAVDHELLLRLAMPRHAEHLVEIAFEMPVNTGLQTHRSRINADQTA